MGKNGAIRFLAGLMALGLLLTACSGSGSGSKETAPAPTNNTSAPAPKQEAPKEPTTTFKFVMTANPTGFDPHMVSDVATMYLLENIYGGLVAFDEKGAVVNDMAEKIDVGADGKTYTFTLKDAKFHDGTKVTAADFVRSMLRAMNPKLESPVTESYLDDIVGYNKFLAAKSAEAKKLAAAKAAKPSDADLKKAEADYAAAADKLYADLVKDPGIVAKDDKTLVITTADAVPYFLAKLTYPTSWVVSKAMPADKALATDPANIKSMIGTGPFKADSFVDKSKFTMKRFADYYGHKAEVGTVELSVITDEIAQVAAYRSGQLDVAGVPLTEYKSIKADTTLSKELLEYPTARVNYFALNQGKLEAARNPKFRQAVSYAINRDQLNDIVFSGTQFPAYGVLPPGIPGALAEKVNGQKFDAAKAKQLLKESGFEGTTFSITYRAQNTTSQRLAEFLQNQLQSNLGLTVKVEPMEWAQLLSSTQKKTVLDAFTLGWSADYLDPQNFLSLLLHTKAPYNRYGYNNTTFDGILDKADRMANGAPRYAEYSKAEQIAVDDVAWVPTHFAKSIWLVKPSVKGFKYNAMLVMPLNYVTVTK